MARAVVSACNDARGVEFTLADDDTIEHDTRNGSAGRA
jgi:hypothetical protein